MQYPYPEDQITDDDRTALADILSVAPNDPDVRDQTHWSLIGLSLYRRRCERIALLDGVRQGITRGLVLAREASEATTIDSP